MGDGEQPRPVYLPANRDQVLQWILELTNAETREHALLELAPKREVYPDLAPWLWNSCGIMAALLQEVIDIYPAIDPPALTPHQLNRACNALGLLQCVASHHETRPKFILANVPLYLYPFLHTDSKTKSFEYLRLTILSIIYAMVKTDEHDVIEFLIKSEIIPPCLRIMEIGSELSKTVSTIILEKIMLDDSGLTYICHNDERRSHVITTLGKVILSLLKQPFPILLKHAVRCYLRLSDDPQAREELRQCLPEQLRNETFSGDEPEDKFTKEWLAQLLKNLDTPETAGDPTQPEKLPLTSE